MKQVYTYLKDYIKSDFNVFTYSYTAIFLIIAFIINYGFDFEDKILSKTYGKPSGFFYYSVYYAFAYFAIVIPIVLYYKKQKILKDHRFWIKSISFVALIGVAGAFYYYDDILSLFNDALEQFYVKKILINSKRTVLYLIPLFIIKMIFDKDVKGLYGLRFKQFNIKPYFIMLLIMIPVIVWASYQPDFLNVYPKFRPWIGSEVFSLNTWQRTAIFEFIYGLDFVFVELIFRGTLVIGMVSLLGKDVILPMVVTYAFLHFGKPMPEAIGSIFGAYILGVIALYTKNIMGGCIIHMGVAFLMELLAMGQYYIYGN